MGGKVAMWFALHHRDRVNKLIVADIAPVTYARSFDNLICALKSLPLAELNNRKQAEEYLSSAIPELTYRQFLLQNLMLQNGSYGWRVDLDIFQANAANIVSFPDCFGLPAFTGEMQVVAGSRSNFVKHGDFNALFPTAQFHWIADAGHWLHVEKPGAFLEQMRIFLSL
jgi:pimeloyl-ACP methyl ester carboxylesterase